MNNVSPNFICFKHLELIVDLRKKTSAYIYTQLIASDLNQAHIKNINRTILIMKR